MRDLELSTDCIVPHFFLSSVFLPVVKAFGLRLKTIGLFSPANQAFDRCPLLRRLDLAQLRRLRPR